MFYIRDKVIKYLLIDSLMNQMSERFMIVFFVYFIRLYRQEDSTKNNFLKTVTETHKQVTGS